MKNIFLLFIKSFIQSGNPEVDTVVVSKDFSTTSNFWLVGLGVLIVIIIITGYIIGKKYFKPKHKINVPDDWKKKGYKPDFSNLHKGVSGEARKLYSELIRKCHPDRFVGDKDRLEIATELSGKITENMHNYSNLIELKEQAKQKLGISFD